MYLAIDSTTTQSKRTPLRNEEAALPKKPHVQEANSSALLQDLKRKGHVFTGHSSPHAAAFSNQALLSTGYAQLDKALGGGFATGQLHEVQLPFLFVGESRMLIQAIGYATERSAPVFWLNPPASPSAQGIHLTTSAQGSQSHHEDAVHFVMQDLTARELLWAAQQVLQSMRCAALFIWHPNPDAHTVRCWQRALQQSTDSVVVVFSNYMPVEARAYQTRLQLCLEHAHVSFNVLKRSGGWPVRTTGVALRGCAK